MNSVDNSKFNNDWYKPGASKIKIVLWLMINATFLRNPLNLSSRVKKFWLNAFGAKIGSGVLIKPSINIKYPWKLEVGENTWIGENVWIDNLAQVTIGKNVCLSQGAFLLTGNHNYKKEAFDLMVGEIILEDGVWIGAQSTVTPGITCYSHSILSVNSVATKNLSPYKIYQGNPAIEVRDRKITS